MPDDGSPPFARGQATVRRAQIQDIGHIAQIELNAFPGDRISRRRLRALASAPTADFMVASVDDRIIGYALVLRRSTSRTARLYSLAVSSEWAGRGIGSALLDAAENAARTAGAAALRLEVRADNADALRLYRRRGYRSIGCRENYYQDGATALRFERELPALHRSESHAGSPAQIA